MAFRYRTQGVVLFKKDRGEADNVFTVFTRDFGTLDLWGIASRKISSKLRSNLEPLCVSEIEFIQGKFRRTVTDARIVWRLDEARMNLRTLQIALRVVQTLHALVIREEPDEKVWNLLVSALRGIEEKILPLSCQSIAYYHFFWRLAALLGYRPLLERCGSCRAWFGERDEPLFFEGNSIFCAPCALSGNFDRSVKVSRELAGQIARMLSSEDPSSFSPDGICDAQSLRKATETYFRALLAI